MFCPLRGAKQKVSAHGLQVDQHEPNSLVLNPCKDFIVDLRFLSNLDWRLPQKIYKLNPGNFNPYYIQLNIDHHYFIAT